MRRILFSALLIWAGVAAADDRIKIGLSTALTGPGATFGTDIENTLLFANHELGADRYDIVIEDDKCVGKDAVTVAHKFLDLQHIKYVFGCCSASLLSAQPVYKKSGAIVFAPLATSPNISRSGGTIFRTAPSDTETAHMLFKYIAARHKRVGIVTEQSDYSQDLQDAFISNNADHALEVITETIVPNGTDTKSVLLKFKQAAIDALFINTNSEASFGAILKQLRELNYAVPLYGAYMPGSASFLAEYGKLADGVVFVDFASLARLLTPEGEKLYTKYRAKFGALKSWDIAFSTTLAAFHALDEALQSGTDVRQYLLQHEFSGVFGKYRFDENGDIVGLKHVLRRIKDGAVVDAAE